MARAVRDEVASGSIGSQATLEPNRSLRGFKNNRSAGAHSVLWRNEAASVLQLESTVALAFIEVELPRKLDRRWAALSPAKQRG